MKKPKQKPIATLKINNLHKLSIKDFSNLNMWLAETLRNINKIHITKNEYSNNPKWSLFD